MPARQQPEGWTLSELIGPFTDAAFPEGAMVLDIGADSRRLTPGALFLATAGARRAGLEFLDQALERGAVAVAWDAADERSREIAAQRAAHCPVPLIPIPALRTRLGEIAAHFHGHPSRQLFGVGVTGTDGKTTVAQLVAQALDRPGERCGVIGTLGNGFPGVLRAGTHTTPDAVALQAELAELRAAGAEAVSMEVSSHALDQGRVIGVDFDVAVLTNLGRDHLDYHGDLASYAEAKALLFTRHEPRHAVLNVNDDLGVDLLERLPITTAYLRYGISEGDDQLVGADLRAERLRPRADGLDIDLVTPAGPAVLRSALLGRFNAWNLLAALGVLLVRGLDLPEALRRLEALQPVPGRMQKLPAAAGRPTVIVDYAHTPAALQAALAAAREHCPGTLWCVFGCGGERDEGKRPSMGAIAERMADHVVLTSDNPRDEAPQEIMRAIEAGMAGEPAAALVDRRDAIAFALRHAGARDWVLIAGKGHETVQVVGGRALPFDDRVVALELRSEVGG